MNLNLSHFFLVPLFKLVIVYFFLSVENVYTNTFSCILVIKLDKKNCCTLFFELTNSRNKLIINEKKVLFNYTCCPSFLHVLSFVDAGLVLFFLPLYWGRASAFVSNNQNSLAEIIFFY